MVESGEPPERMWSMLIGEFEHSIDAKGRLIMPAKLRETIGDKFVVTKGLDGCLFAFSLIEWANFEEKLKSLPNNLRESANLQKEVVIIGVGTRIEIWDKEKWNFYNDENISVEDIAENMTMLGI